MNTDKKALTGRDKHFYLTIIAEKEKELDDLKLEHRLDLAEKDEVIAYYAKAAELAADRKRRAIRNAERRAKLNLSYAALILAGMAVIPWVLWLVDAAFKSFWLWAN